MKYSIFSVCIASLYKYQKMYTFRDKALKLYLQALAKQLAGQLL